jgi:nuclear transport factor 2 (NTF2) superfamily protein
MVGVTNAYGETINVSCEQIYDFKKESELTYFNFEFQDDNGNWIAPNGEYKFIEGMFIRATYKIKKWQAETIAFEI